MSRWQKVWETNPKGQFIKVTNNSGRSFLCANDSDAEWLLKLLEKHAPEPNTWHR